MSIGLFVLRLLIAALLFGHATQKLFGWFRGMGPAGTGKIFETWGFRPGRQLVLLAGACELTGVVLLVLGLATPLAAAIISGTMIVAASPSFAKGLWAQFGGYEVPFLYGTLALVVALTGPGPWSLDHAFGFTGLSGIPWALAAAVVGATAAVPPLLLRRRNLQAPAAESATP